MGITSVKHIDPFALFIYILIKLLSKYYLINDDQKDEFKVNLQIFIDNITKIIKKIINILNKMKSRISIIERRFSKNTNIQKNTVDIKNFE